MGYDLRRLTRKGFIGRVKGKYCYTLTHNGRRCALFLTKTHARVLRPGPGPSIRTLTRGTHCTAYCPRRRRRHH
jgi:hypothetical protein